MNKFVVFRLISCGRLISLVLIALIFTAIVGGASFAGNPDFNLGLVEDWVCPDDSVLAYREGSLETFETFPSETNPVGDTTSARSFIVRCVAQGNVVASGDGLLIRTLAAVLGGYYLACFLPLVILSSLALWILPRRLKTSNSK